jgi:TolA-binding protein
MKLKMLCGVAMVVATVAPLRSQCEGTPDKMWELAQKCIECNSPDLAREMCLKILYLSPKNDFQDDAQYLLGVAFERVGSLYFAIEEWEKLIQKYPDSSWVPKAKEKIALAKTALVDSVYDTVTLEDRVAEKYIWWADDFKNRSKTFSDTGVIRYKDYLNAAEYWYTKVITMFPKSNKAPHAQYNLGDAYLYQDDPGFFQKAVDAYELVVANYPKSIWANKAALQIGIVYEDNIRNKKKAIDAYQNVLERNGNDLNNYYVTFARARLQYLGVKLDK